MANKKLTDLTETTSVSGSDYIYVVRDPGGSPEDNKITVDNFLKTLFGETNVFTNSNEFRHSTLTPIVLVNGSGAAPIAPDAPTIAMFTGHSTGVGSRVMFDDYGGHTVLSFRRASGTAASPSGVLLNDSIGAISAIGYGSTGYNAGAASGNMAVDFVCEENWTDAAKGGAVVFATTPQGGTTRSNRWRVAGSGNILPEAANTYDLGSSTLQGRSAYFGTSIFIGTPTPTSITSGTADDVLHMKGTDDFGAIATIDSYGSFASAVVLRRAQGTFGSPTAVLADDILGAVGGRGYHSGGGFNVGNLASIKFFAAENFTPSNQGTYLSLSTTAIGGNIQAEQWRVDSGGNLSSKGSGVLGLPALAFAALPASPQEGMMAGVTNSTTNTWGATIAGGGSNHVLAYYNGSAWTVAGK